MDDIAIYRTKVSFAEWEESLRQGEHPVSRRALNIVRVASGDRIAVCHAALKNKTGYANASWYWAGDKPLVDHFAEILHEFPCYEKRWLLAMVGPCVVGNVRIAANFNDETTYWCPSEAPGDVRG